MKSYLFIMQQDPYSSSKAMEALELALALSSFNQPVSILFKDAGIMQILANKSGQNIVAKDFTKIYSGLDIFGIEKVYIDKSSMEPFATEELLLSPEIVNDAQIADLIKNHDVTLTI